MKKLVALSLSVIVIGFCVYVMYDATKSTYLFVGAGVEIPELDAASYQNESKEEILTRYIAIANYANSLVYNGEIATLKAFRWLCIVTGLLVLSTIGLSVMLWYHSNKSSKRDARKARAPS